MRTIKPIKNEIKKLVGGVPPVKVDSKGNAYRIVDGRRILVDENQLEHSRAAEIQKQQAAIVAVQTRKHRPKHKVVVPQKKDKKK